VLAGRDAGRLGEGGEEPPVGQADRVVGEADGGERAGGCLD
jgi:hypothetical protein